MNTFSKTVILSACLLSTQAFAADHYVTPSSIPSLEDVVTSSNSGDTIYASSGSYNVQLTIDKELTIVGDGWNTIFSGGLSSEIIEVTASGDLILESIQLSNGGGLAALTNWGQTQLSEVEITGSQATFGAILNYGDMGLDSNSVLSGNQSTSYYAGGLNNFQGYVDMDNTALISNSGHSGGAIMNLLGLMYISDSSFTSNSAYLGGALHNNQGNVTVVDSSFSTNFATSIGGAYSNHNLVGTVNVANVGFAANTTGTGNYKDCYDPSNSSCL